ARTGPCRADRNRTPPPRSRARARPSGTAGTACRSDDLTATRTALGRLPHRTLSRHGPQDGGRRLSPQMTEPEIMTLFRRAALAAALAGTALLAALPAGARDLTVGALTIDHPWARPNLPNRPLAVYFTVSNAGTTADRLIAASGAGFDAIELHTVIHDGDVMKMQKIEALDIPAGGSATLAPGGNHMMLFGATTLYPEGARFPLTLTFEGTGEIAIEVTVEKRGPAQGTGHGMGHGAAPKN
ncbi:MAG: copper chaperone PCu(A)C, partial [Thermohalobaculum sp.]|nr:copper chaperone PCu(A)C [Thermohalobaculum sp.]